MKEFILKYQILWYLLSVAGLGYANFILWRNQKALEAREFAEISGNAPIIGSMLLAIVSASFSLLAQFWNIHK